MRNSHNITLTNNDSLTEDEETTWSLPGAVVGFISWLFALAMPMLIYGSNTLFFFIYTWPFFLALMPVALGLRYFGSHGMWSSNHCAWRARARMASVLAWFT